MADGSCACGVPATLIKDAVRSRQCGSDLGTGVVFLRKDDRRYLQPQCPLRPMSKLSLQLHVLPEDVEELFIDLLQDTSIHLALAEGLPLKFRQPEGRTIVPADCRALAFSISPVALNVHTMNDFRRLNPDALLFEIGQLKPEGLAESWLSAMTTNSDAMNRWKRTAKSIQMRTLTGAIALNPKTGATVPIKGHRFSASAQDLFCKGLAMLPAAGNSIVQLPPL